MVIGKSHWVVGYFVARKNYEVQGQPLPEQITQKALFMLKKQKKAKVLTSFEQQEPTRSWDRKIADCHARPQAKHDCCEST